MDDHARRGRRVKREHPLPEQFGKYKILGHVATGGMADIHLARAVGVGGFEKLVVVKSILPNLAADTHFIQMFVEEARLAATLQHPNIVQVYDIGVVDGDYFFSMEFLHGEDVSHTMKRAHAIGAKLPLEHALHIVLGVCAGLHYAHEKAGFDGRPLGIVHRDVSPQNVFVTYDGGVKLVDFGIAKASSRVAQTRYGTLKGKIRYMSPEQCRAWPIDRRSDVFSVSILLWELTTGRRLFCGPSDFEILKSIVERDAPVPSIWRADYPPELERIVMRGLRRDPHERYATAQDMQADLEDFVREQKLAVSSIAISRFMRRLFQDKLLAWEAAQRSREALTSHIVQTKAAAAGDTPWLEDSAPEPETQAVTQAQQMIATRLPQLPPMADELTQITRQRQRRRRIGMAGAAVVVAVAAAIALPVWHKPAAIPGPPAPPVEFPIERAPIAVPLPQAAPVVPEPPPPAERRPSRKHSSHRRHHEPVEQSPPAPKPLPAQEIDYDAPLAP